MHFDGHRCIFDEWMGAFMMVLGAFWMDLWVDTPINLSKPQERQTFGRNQQDKIRECYFCNRIHRKMASP